MKGKVFDMAFVFCTVQALVIRRGVWSLALVGLVAGCADAGAPADVDASTQPDALSVDGVSVPDAVPDAALSCISGDGLCPTGCAAPDLDCVACDLTVPDDRPTIGDAILDAPAPGTVCIRAGSYAEHVESRYRVHLQGQGPATVIEGNLDLRGVLTSDSTAMETAIRDLTVAIPVGGSALGLCPDSALLCGARIAAARTLALLVERVQLISNVDPSSYTTYCVLLGSAGSLRLTIRDSLCRSDRGMRIAGTIGTTDPDEYALLFERNRFEPMAGRPALNWPVQLLINATWNSNGYYEVAPLGTRVNAVLRNNEFFHSSPEAIYLTGAILLAPGDEPFSAYDFRHNTFVVGAGIAIWNRITTTHPALRLANNLYWDGAYSGPAPALDEANLQPTSDPFVSVGQGDLQLALGSEPVDAANPNYSVADDFAERTRPMDGDDDGVAAPDVGAHELHPMVLSTSR